MKRIVFLLALTIPYSLAGICQTSIDLSNLDAFDVGKNWQIAGDVSASITEHENMIPTKGSGVLVNLPTSKRKSNLLTKASFGDLDLEVEFMMASHSNSGIYLQGRYEVQLLDSWGKMNPTYGDCGGIYQRRRKDGSQYEGHAPLVNACKAPGTWQKMFISFQAPRFDSEGNKIKNAKILEVRLNGYTVQRNIELTGPTGGPISEEEAAKGPIMIQGDHGPVAFRNMKITSFQETDLSINNLSATRYFGEIKPLQQFDYSGMKSEQISTSEINVVDFVEELGWSIVYKGDLNIPEDGDYTLSMVAGGESMMKLNGEVAVEKGWSRPNWDPRSSQPLSLAKGTHPIEIYYSKVDGWLPTGLGVYVESTNLRRQALHSGLDASLLSIGEGPVFLDADKPKVNRSFISYPDGDENIVLTHVVNVGDPGGLHYSYNTANGALVKVWRGDYLDVSPMWNGRGNAQANSLGPELVLPNMAPLVVSLDQSRKPLGYDINSSGHPTFRYMLGGSEVQDEIKSVAGKRIERKLSGEALEGAMLALGGSISKVSESLYSVNDKEYFVEFSGPAEIKSGAKGMWLVSTAATKSLTYSIIW